MESHTVNSSTQPPRGRILNPIFDVCWPMLCQECRQWRASLGHALTTLFAGSVVTGLFIYIFGDFVKDKLPAINPQLAVQVLSIGILVALTVVNYALLRWINRRIFASEGWFAQLKTWAIFPRQIHVAQILMSAYVLTKGLSCSGIVVQIFIGQWEWLHTAWSFVLIGLTTAWIALRRSTKDLDQTPTWVDQAPSNFAAIRDADTLADWRYRRIKSGRWPGSKLPWLAGTLLLLTPASILIQSPLIISEMVCLVAGIIVSWILPFLIDDDLKTTWIEHQAATSHDQWIRAWQSIVSRWAGYLFLVTTVVATCALASVVIFHHVDVRPDQIGAAGFGVGPWVGILMTGTLHGFLATFTLWLAPSLALQIDGRYPLTNILVLTLTGIFMGTAIMAIPYAAPVIWFLQKEAHRYQGGRFARSTHR